MHTHTVFSQIQEDSKIFILKKKNREKREALVNTVFKLCISGSVELLLLTKTKTIKNMLFSKMKLK